VGRVYDATWGRLFAALYDRILRSTEEGGLLEMRRELLVGASGRTIEIGAGTGVNLDLYPAAVSDLVLAEPDPHMAKRLRAKLSESGRDARVVEAPAERLPFEDGGFDTAVSTLVLCTVPDPAGTLSELARVPEAGRPPALRRARPLRGPGHGPLAGPPRTALALPRRRLPLQPRHGSHARRLALRARAARARPAAQVPVLRQAADPRRRKPAGLSRCLEQRCEFPSGIRGKGTPRDLS
jgi:SAM-dependent methyltransferase